jgi:hypothetical protein
MANEEIRMGADAMNAAVARIGKVSRKVFEDKSTSSAEPAVPAAPSPRRVLAEVAARPNPGPGHKNFAPRGDNNSLAQKVPSHEMPPKKAAMEQPGTDGYDDDEETVAKPEQGAKKESIMNRVMKATGLASVEEWKRLSGMTPLYETVDRGTGAVPTAGVNKQNKPKGGGLPGLEGTAVQDIDPSESFDDGADEEETFDAAPGDLKKESYNRHFGHFLEQRGLTPELFAQLVDEAIQSNDVEEMNALLTVEGMFSTFMKKKKAAGGADKDISMLRKTKSVMQAKKDGKLDNYGRPKKAAAEEGFAFECDDDGKGGPDWRKALSSMKRGR